MAKGNDYRPGPGKGGKIPGNEVGSTPKPKADPTPKKLKSGFGGSQTNLPVKGPRTGRK